MRRTNITVILGITLLCLCGCEEEASQTQSLPIAVEGDEIIKTVIEEMLRSNPKIYISPSNPSIPGPSTEYTIQIVEPDPSKTYSILRVEPDSNTEYSMMMIDPKTQKPPTTIDPNTLDAILEELKHRKEEATDK